MKTVSRFLETEQAPQVPVRLDGQALSLPEGANLAAALIAAGVQPLRHNPVSGAPRMPYCLMGACFECLVQVDGVSLRACTLQVEADMNIQRLRPREAEHGAA